MCKVNMFFADGFEEVEALTVVDLLRRVGITTNMVSITGNLEVAGAHNINIKTDVLFENASDADMIILPGGMPGTNNLKAHNGLCEMILDYYKNGKYLAAICAAPTVFGSLGILKDRHATCYPGMESGLNCIEALEDAVVIDDKIITSRGLGTAIDFGLAIIEMLKNEETAIDLANKIVYKM